jgi:nitrite reductase/ring-hydroxylating ferredoxin subunit
MASQPMNTLPGRDYHAAEVFDLERELVFARNWFYAGRAEGLDEPGDFVTVDVAGESVIVVRDADGRLQAFYNVCRHRGSRLCDEASGRMKGAVKCPYHAWAYSFDGRLIGTPNVGKDELDRSSLGVAGRTGRMAGVPVPAPGRGSTADRGLAGRTARQPIAVCAVQSGWTAARSPDGD